MPSGSVQSGSVLQVLARSRVGGDVDRKAPLLPHRDQALEQHLEAGGGVDVLLAVGTDQEVAAIGQRKAVEDVRGLNLREVLIQDLTHR